jgi:hypothetical protein
LVLAGSSQAFTYSALNGYTLNQLLIDGVPASLATYPSSYTFSTVSADHTISVSSVVAPLKSAGAITDLMKYVAVAAIAVIIAIATAGILILRKKRARSQTHLDEYFWEENVRADHNMTTVGFEKIYVKVKRYLRENWGSPFIVAFMLLLLSAAVYLSSGLSSLANAIAIYAYYALVAGVILQFVSFLKYRKKDGEAV